MTQNGSNKFSKSMWLLKIFIIFFCLNMLPYGLLGVSKQFIFVEQQGVFLENGSPWDWQSKGRTLSRSAAKALSNVLGLTTRSSKYQECYFKINATNKSSITFKLASLEYETRIRNEIIGSGSFNPDDVVIFSPDKANLLVLPVTIKQSKEISRLLSGDDPLTTKLKAWIVVGNYQFCVPLELDMKPEF